jgi:hypothetical protein
MLVNRRYHGTILVESIPSANVDGGHRDDVHSDSDRNTDQNGDISRILAVRVPHDKVIDAGSENIWRRGEHQGKSAVIVEGGNNSREEVGNGSLGLRKEVAAAFVLVSLKIKSEGNMSV